MQSPVAKSHEPQCNPQSQEITNQELTQQKSPIPIRILRPTTKWGPLWRSKMTKLQALTYSEPWFDGHASTEPQSPNHCGVGGNQVHDHLDTSAQVVDFLKKYGHWPFCQVTAHRTRWWVTDGVQSGENVYEIIYHRDIPPDEWSYVLAKEAELAV